MLGLCAGAHHTCILSAEGHLYASGVIGQGRITLQVRKRVLEPVRIDMGDFEVLGIACGGAQTMVWARERRGSYRVGVQIGSVTVVQRENQDPSVCHDVKAAMRDYVGKKLNEAESLHSK
jgi:hypothetical protein